MKVLRICLLVGAALGLAGCASYFKRKECEKTNWYQHGYGVAMSGKRLDADDFVKQCQKVEAKMSFTELDTGFKAGMAKYCSADNVYDVGKAGNPFSYDMCDGESLRKMQVRYAEGLRVFCTPKNAYRFGSSGGIYQNVCPKEVESDWLAEYRKGRKIHLNAVIQVKQDEIRRLDQNVRDLESKRSRLAFEQRTMTMRYESRTERVYDLATNTYKEQTVSGPAEESRQRQDQLQNEIRSVDRQIDDVRRKQDGLNSEIDRMRTEMVTL
ncbi:MAG: DUF2799 domain-containing protein [Bdellovibrionales bacterium]